MPRDPFDLTRKFINGQQTPRPSPGGTVPSPPAVPGTKILNREGDLALGAVTQNPPSYPVDSDEYPVAQPLSLDTNGNLRATFAGPIVISGNVNATIVGPLPLPVTDVVVEANTAQTNVLLAALQALLTTLSNLATLQQSQTDLLNLILARLEATAIMLASQNNYVATSEVLQSIN